MEIVAATPSHHDLLDAQKDLFQNQIEKLQHIVATQCELTGVNPLSTEMAAGALSIKIGKRPRDLLNPKAVQYMQCVFSIKDAINKRETREISAQFGVTATQVRDFFTGQRSRVRKFVRLATEKSNGSSASAAMQTPISDPNMHAAEPVPLDSIAPAPIDVYDEPSCSKSHEVLSGEGSSDVHLDSIFSSMRKEESFSAQVKLLRSILRMKNSTVHNRFLAEGGLMILATWLSQAAKEEQTSFLRVILKVLQYLPMSKALPVHMSAVLQSVNRLRFYRASDISHRARSLLSQWSSMFGKNLSQKKSNGLKSASELQDEMLLKQSINEVMGNESWDLKDNSDEALRALCDNPHNHRKLNSAQPLKMLTASGDESNKRRGVLPSHSRERRKVQMVEHPGQRMAVRSPQVARSTPATQSRPLSADDIQKAKMRAHFMQSKHMKTGPDAKVKPENQETCTSSHASLPLTFNSSVVTELEEKTKPEPALPEPQEISPGLEEPPCKKYRRIQIPWHIPPEMKIREDWSVGYGADSKEVEVQKNRIRREREIVYRSFQEIPSDPREPWDREMDSDDSLTPEIPTEQLPDVEPAEIISVSANGGDGIVAPVASTSSMPEPDLELLAELLKNPELVFALTSGQAGNFSSNETVKLLDMIKANGVNSLGGLAGVADNKVEVSLPSPTPSTNPVTNGPKPDFSRNPFSRQHASVNINTFQHQIPAATMMTPQPSTTVQHAVVPPQLPVQTNIHFPEQWNSPNSQIHHQSIPPNSSNLYQQHLTTEMLLNTNMVANPSLVPPSGSLVSNHLGLRQGFEPNYYQNNQALSNCNAYAGGSVPSRNSRVGRPGFESWGPDDSPSRRHEHEYLPPGPYYREPSPNVNSRHGYRQERAPQQNLGQPSGYQDRGPGNRRWPDHRR